MTTGYKVTELFCIIDDFCKHFNAENAGNLLEDNSGVKRRRRQASLSDSEIMTILLYFHFGTFRNFKHYYMFFIKGTMKSYFPKAVSYNRFVELESRVFFQLMFFLNLGAFGRCTGITFVDSTMIPVCRNLRRYTNKVFEGIATDGKGTMGWCHGFKLHLACNVETINDKLKNTAQIVHSHHRSVRNYIMNLISALGAYCFFDNKPKALQRYCIEDTKQLSLF